MKFGEPIKVGHNLNGNGLFLFHFWAHKCKKSVVLYKPIKNQFNN